MSDKPPMDPNNTILVLKHDGREVGRIAAASPKANAYVEEMSRHYNGLQIDYVEDKEAADVARLLSGIWR